MGAWGVRRGLLLLSALFCLSARAQNSCANIFETLPVTNLITDSLEENLPSLLEVGINLQHKTDISAKPFDSQSLLSLYEGVLIDRQGDAVELSLALRYENQQDLPGAEPVWARMDDAVLYAESAVEHTPQQIPLTFIEEIYNTRFSQSRRVASFEAVVVNEAGSLWRVYVEVKESLQDGHWLPDGAADVYAVPFD